MSDLDRCRDLSEAGDIDNAYRIADAHLKRNPESPAWMMAMTHILLQAEKPVVAYTMARRTTQIEPENAGVWLNLGMAARDLWRFREARRAYRKGLRAAKTDDQRSMLYVNLSSLSVDSGYFKEGESYCKQALEYSDSQKATANLGFCQLAQSNFEEGWTNYRACIGTEWRPKFQYNHEPLWDGKSKGTIVVYGEQGLGDMICFAAMLGDMKTWCDANGSRLIVVIDTRLKPLLSRTYPDIEFHGGLGQPAKWDTSCVNYSLPIGQLAEYFRNKPFKETPYLVPDPDRVLQWEALFETKQKPVIGLAWTGGIPKTGSHFRRTQLEQMLPLFESIDAHWVSLQYKPSGAEIERFRTEYDVDIAEYPHATLMQDYDNTAALVAALDAVVGVPTTVIHAAGCLGVRTIAMHAPVKCWKFAAGVPFHPVTLIGHHDDWNQTIKDTASHLEDLCIEYSSGSIDDSPLPITSLNSQSSETLLNRSA